MHLFQCLPRQPFKRGKSLEEPSLPPPEGAPRLVPETQRSPGRRMVRPSGCGLRNPAPSHRACRKMVGHAYYQRTSRRRRKQPLATSSQNQGL